MPTTKKLVYYSYLSRSGFSPHAVIFHETLRNLMQRVTKYNKRVGDSFGCDWREKFCEKVKQSGFLHWEKSAKIGHKFVQTIF